MTTDAEVEAAAKAYYTLNPHIRRGWPGTGERIKWDELYEADLRHYRDSMRAALTAAAAARPQADGWQLAPPQPTEAMWQAGKEADEHPGDSYTKVYCAMLAAVPPIKTEG